LNCLTDGKLETGEKCWGNVPLLAFDTLGYDCQLSNTLSSRFDLHDMSSQVCPSGVK